jgi:hypothetical protein
MSETENRPLRLTERDLHVHLPAAMANAIAVAARRRSMGLSTYTRMALADALRADARADKQQEHAHHE